MALFRLYPYLKKAPVLGSLLNRPVRPLADAGALPRHIYLYWDKGLAEAPELVRLCVASWERQNPGWTVTVLDRAAADAILPFSGLPPQIRPAHYADLLRIVLMRDQGGVWADATVWCTRPLDHWLPMVMCQSDFFAFARPGPDRMVSSWFLAAAPGSRIAADWAELSLKLWRGERGGARAYFWFHYLFEYRWLTSAGFRRAWAAVPALEASAPHVAQRRLRAGGEITPAEAAALKAAAMQKLTYKWEVPVERVAALLADQAPNRA
jgi:hypothetical protein